MTVLSALTVAPLVFLTLIFSIELFVGMRPLRGLAQSERKPIRLAIIVPAHNEEAILAGRLQALSEAARGLGRILVVADNCSDSTAAIARRFDVDVIERNDSARRGKGYALDFAKQALRTDAPDVVMIIDADCATTAPSIAALSESCAAWDVPCQAINLQSPSAASSPAVKLSTFAFFIRNVVRQRALQRLAGRVHLLGTGMAFPWRLFADAELATGNIVEDLKLGHDLAEAGHPARLVEDAVVWSNAETQSNTLSQRRRWEGGFLQHASLLAPPMFARSLRRGDPKQLWAAADIMVPPFALLIMTDVAIIGVAILFALLAGPSWWPALILGVAVLLTALGLILAQRFAGGSRFVSLADLAQAPLYLAWKLPIYLGFARHGAPAEWKRTDRDTA